MRHALGILFLTVAGTSRAGDAPKPSPVKEPELRAELVQRAQADQDARRAMIEWMTRFGNRGLTDKAAFEATLDPTQKAEFRKLADTLRQVDADNTDRLGAIVKRYGWPTYSLVGQDGANAAWLLVQHADSSPSFQRKCLDLMAKVSRDEVSRKDVAYLTDRVLLAEGKKQVYGTQVTRANGKWQPRPLEDEAEVDARRAEVGLPPLAEYLKEVESLYGGETK